MNKIETAEYNRILEQNKSLQTEVIKLRQENEDLRVLVSQHAQRIDELERGKNAGQI